MPSVESQPTFNSASRIYAASSTEASLYIETYLSGIKIDEHTNPAI